MNHENIINKLLLYIDNGLSHQEMVEIKAHIDICTDCRKHLTELSGLWKLEKAESKDIPKYIWTRLEAEIKEYEQNPASFVIFHVRKKFAYILQPAVMAFLVFVSVLSGYFGGNFLSKEMNGNHAISNNEQVSEVFFLDRLETEDISNSLIITYRGNGEGVLP